MSTQTLRRKKLRAIDFFCGAGGTSRGAEDTGEIAVTHAVNHWDVAIQAHSLNFRECHHFTHRMEDLKPNQVDKGIRIFYASPECIHHSRARGSAPKNDQSRCQANDILTWAWHHRPSFIVVENVVEFVEWGPIDRKGDPIPKFKGKLFDAWVMSLRGMGYNVEWRVLNCADFGAATSRPRLFVIARLGTKRVPWPEPTHTKTAGGELPGMGLPRWRSAAEVIDWSIPFPSIFGRQRPLKPKTIRRIDIGLNKFVDPFVFQLMGNGLSDPSYSGARSIDKPSPTILTRNNHGIVVPYICTLRNNTTTQSLAQPVGTITAGGRHHGLALPYLVHTAHGDKPGSASPRCHSLNDPLSTITAKRSTAIACPVLMRYYGTNTCNSVEDPVGTVTCEDRHAILLPCSGVPIPQIPDDPAYHTLIETMTRLGVHDIGFRMFTNRELARAQSFSDDFQFAGKSSEITRQIGNAVPPIMAYHLSAAILSV